MDLLISWLILSAIVYLTAVIVPGFKVRGAGGAVVTAGLFGLLQWALGKLIFVLIGVGTLGLGFLLAFITRWIVMAIVLKIVDAVTDRLTIVSFGRALLAALVMAGLGTVAEWLFHRVVFA